MAHGRLRRLRCSFPRCPPRPRSGPEEYRTRILNCKTIHIHYGPTYSARALAPSHYSSWPLQHHPLPRPHPLAAAALVHHCAETHAAHRDVRHSRQRGASRWRTASGTASPARSRRASRPSSSSAGPAVTLCPLIHRRQVNAVEHVHRPETQHSHAVIGNELAEADAGQRDAADEAKPRRVILLYRPLTTRPPADRFAIFESMERSSASSTTSCPLTLE